MNPILQPAAIVAERFQDFLEYVSANHPELIANYTQANLLSQFHLIRTMARAKYKSKKAWKQ